MDLFLFLSEIYQYLYRNLWNLWGMTSRSLSIFGLILKLFHSHQVSTLYRSPLTNVAVLIVSQLILASHPINQCAARLYCFHTWNPLAPLFCCFSTHTFHNSNYAFSFHKPHLLAPKLWKDCDQKFCPHFSSNQFYLTGGAYY